MSKKGIGSFLWGGIATGAIWGSTEAFWLQSHTLHLPGSGDPWLIAEGVVLYAIAGLVAGLLAFILVRNLPDIVIFSAPFFALILVLALCEVNLRIAADFFSWQGISASVGVFVITCVLFWVFTKLLNPLYSFIQVLLWIGFVASIVLTFWNSPLHQIALPASSPVGKPNIIFITMDTTRADHLTPYGYSRNTSPFLAKLAQAGTVFEKAYSVSSWTLPSHSSLFTGKLPSVHGAIYTHWWLDSKQTTIAEILQKQGYRTAAFVSGPFLLPSFNIQQGFQYYDDQLDPYSGLQRFLLARIVRRFTKKRLPWVDGQRNGNEVNGHVLSWLRDYQDPSPFFLFINYFDPHDPYRPPPPFDTMYDPNYTGRMNGFIDGIYKNRTNGARIGKDGKRLTKADYTHLVALYDGEIQFMDQQIEKLFEYLHSKPYFKHTIVILIGDHGESIGEHELLDHGHTLYEEQVHVPLIILGPGIPQGKRISNLVRSIDVMPFLLHQIHIAVPPDIQGASFASYLNGSAQDNRTYIGEIFRDPDTRVKRFQRNQKAILEGDWKFLWSSNGNHELFDLLKDHQENENLLTAQTATADRLQQVLLGYLKRLPQNVSERSIPLDEWTKESLEANNYVH